MAQWVRALVTEHSDLNWIPMVEAENQLPQGVLWPPRLLCGTCTPNSQINSAHTRMLVEGLKIVTPGKPVEESAELLPDVAGLPLLDCRASFKFPRP